MTMAKPAPDTKNWEAWIDTMPGGPGHMTVIGDVDVGNIAASAHLKEHNPQGINPKILLLDLTITLDGEGYPKKIYKQARFDKPASKGQYTSVDILWEGDKIADIEVKEVS
jgi:hypothetical protein